MPEVTRGLIIVDHGSRRPDAHEHLARVAAAVRERCPDLLVSVAHMELAAPSLAEALDACVASGANPVWIHPLFLVPGHHLVTDIPALVASAASRHPDVAIELTPALGMSPGIADLILSTLPSS